MENFYAQIVIDRIITLLVALSAAVLAAFLTFIFLYLIVIYLRMKKREKMSLEMETVEVKLQRENEIKIDAAEQMFASFSSLKKGGWFSSW